MPKHIAWIDTETTGVDFDDKLLSIAMIITDEQFNKIDQYVCDVRYNLDEINKMYMQSDRIVQQMHHISGLWDKLNLIDALPIDIIDDQMYEILTKINVEPRKIRVAGNSTRLDLNMIEKYLPQTYSHLHYQMLDMTSVSYYLQITKKFDRYRGKTGSHEAIIDIQESIDEAEYFKKLLNS